MKVDTSMPIQQVDPKVVSVWRWQWVLTFAVLSIPLIGVLLRAPSPVSWLLPGAYAMFAICCVWLLPPAWYRALGYAVDAQGITIQRGIFWHSRIALPRIRIQHSDVAQGPLERRYGIATVKLYTAGSRYTKIELTGLAHGDALALRETLIAGDGHSGV